MNLIDAFVHNPVKIAVGVLLLVLFGVIGLMRMPMQLTPEVEIPTLTVTTDWPGASPQEIETEIVQEQEEQLQSVEGVTEMVSESMNSQAVIRLEFAVGADMDRALLMVNARLNQVPEYPEDVDQPVITTSSSSDSAIAWFMLTAKAPSAEQFAEYRAKFPQLADELEAAENSRTSGLVMLRLRRLAAEHPEIEPLLPDVDVTKMKRFAEDNIEAAFERVPGVSNSNVFGGREEELQVIVDPDKLAARTLTIDDVRTALRTANQDTSAGDVWEGKRRWVVRTIGQFESIEQVENTIIARRNGASVYVKHIGRVVLGYKKPTSSVRRFGTECIAINVIRTTGANVLDVMAGLRETNEELNESVLPRYGVELTQVYDETEYIYSSIGLVESNIYLGGTLTVIVLLTFLRSGRSTLVIALAIPISLIGTFLVLSLLGRSLNVISLAGLAFAVGMLVDNAVVVLENIYRHWQMGKPPFAAAVTGAQEVWGAVVASTLTTLAVFVPVLFVQQEAGQLFRDIALAVSSAVGLSMIVSIMVIPVAAARILGNRDEDEAESDAIEAESTGDGRPADMPTTGGSDRNGDTYHLDDYHERTHRDMGQRDDSDKDDAVTAEVADQPQPVAEAHPRDTGAPTRWTAPLRPIGRGLNWVGEQFIAGIVGLNIWLHGGLVRRVAVSLILLVAAVVGSFLLAPSPEYLPNGNRNLAIGIVQPPPGYNLPELIGMGEEIETALMPYWDVDPESPAARQLAFPVIEDFFYVASGRRIFFGLRSHDALRSGELPALIMDVGRELEGAYTFAFQTSLFEQGLTAGRNVAIEFTGPDLERLVGLGGQTMGMLGQEFDEPGEKGMMRPVPSLDLSSPELHVLAKPERAKDMGIDNQRLGYAVNALVDGAYATDYYLGGDKIDLSIIGSESFVERTQDIRQLPIATPTGEIVPLAAVANVEWDSGPEQINRLERQRSITIEFAPGPAISLQEAINRIENKIIAPLREGGQLDGGYQVGLGGTADKLVETWDALKWNLMLALLITYLLMAALFESWLYPFVIILSVPLGAVGGFAALAVLNLFVPQALDVLTMLGFVILIGTVVNNPILIVHQALNHIREDGMNPHEAVTESVRTRIRPIFMTTTTTVLGLLPLVVMPGAGSELYRGLGAVVLGGLVVSTIFTLLLVPTLFSLMLELRGGIARTAKTIQRKTTRPGSPKPKPEPQPTAT